MRRPPVRIIAPMAMLMKASSQCQPVARIRRAEAITPMELSRSPIKCHRALFTLRLSSSFILRLRTMVRTIFTIRPMVEMMSITG
ncbi:hypothetical protein D3C75_1145390 [compost metagenome]